ncbi:MAG TPA: hypothetical protein ENH01_06335 [Nitrospirae bacterium]|nr:hypothetical protein [Nitrospirota bacterium]
MGKPVAVSFEGNEVKIVHALQRGGNIKIKGTEIIAVEEFDGYLKRSKDKDFIVTCDFKESYHDVLSVPLLKTGYLVKIIETEIRKTTGRKDFTFLYLPIGDRVINNRKMLDIFYFMVTDETIRDVVDMFYNCGKTVKALYPPVFAAASLLEPGAPGEADMGIIYTGNERTIFSTKNGAVNFIRNYDPHEAGFSDFDIENINMTINYCRQNLRTSPLSVKLGNCQESCPIYFTQPYANYALWPAPL